MVEREAAIRAQGLSKDFGNRSVLRWIDLAIRPGQCVGFTGVNGAGKTTLLRCLAGLVRPTSGEVRWFGQPAWNRPAQRRLIGMVAHESRLYPHLTLRENLVFAGRMCGVTEPRRAADQLLEELALASHANVPAMQISRGMHQRLAVARALIHNPPILLLDEPFSGLDADGSRWLDEMLLGLRGRGRTICFSSHDQERTSHLAHEVFELRTGQLWRRDEQRREEPRTTAPLGLVA